MEAKMAEKKNQHFVPQFLLRKFSKEARGKTIRTYIIKSSRIVPNAPIRSQCSDAYFYGADLVRENSLGNIERTISMHLRDTSEEALDALSDADIFSLRRFVHSLRLRTRARFDQEAQMLAAMKGVISREQGADVERLQIDEAFGKICVADEVMCLADTLQTLVDDLGVRFLLNSHAIQFASSDHPVVTHNFYAETHPKFRTYLSCDGLAAKGIQIFLPLSPRLCLALYDQTTYQFDQHGARYCHIGPEDVRTLNEMQAISADQLLILPPDQRFDSELPQLVEARQRHHPIRTQFVRVTESAPDTLGRVRVRYHFTRPSLRVGRGLSCVQVTDHNPFSDHDLAILPYRSPEVERIARRGQ